MVTAILKPNGEQAWPPPTSPAREPFPPAPRPRGRRIALLCRGDDEASRRLLVRLESLLSGLPFRERLCRRADDPGIGLVIVLRSQQLAFFRHGLPTVVIDDRPSAITDRAPPRPTPSEPSNQATIEPNRLETDLVALIERLLDP